MITNKYTKIFERALSGKATVNDIFVFMYFTRYVGINSWSEIEDLVEEQYGERPDWHKCKKMIREYKADIIDFEEDEE